MGFLMQCEYYDVLNRNFDRRDFGWEFVALLRCGKNWWEDEKMAFKSNSGSNLAGSK